MKQITKYIALTGLGLAIGASTGNGISQDNNYNLKQEAPKIITQKQELKRKVGWELNEEDGILYLNSQSGRTSFDNYICSSYDLDNDCQRALEIALEINKIKESINNKIAPPGVSTTHYSAVRLEDSNNDDKIDLISWPVYTTERINLEGTKIQKDAIRVAYLEDVLQSTIKYKNNEN